MIPILTNIIQMDWNHQLVWNVFGMNVLREGLALGSLR